MLQETVFLSSKTIYKLLGEFGVQTEMWLLCTNIAMKILISLVSRT